jgi:DHA1 family multidrug resistance protein-like MFS transporter
VPEVTAGAPNWRRNFFFLWLSQLVAMAAFQSAMPFLPLYVQILGVQDAGEAAVWAGAMSSGGGLTMALMAPVWGALADRYGRKPMVTRSMVASGAVVAIMSAATDVRQLLALRTFQGAFSGTVSAARVLAAGLVPADRLGQSLGLMATAQFVGASAGPLFGGLLARQLGFRTSFVVTGALLALSGVSVFFFVDEHFTRPTVARRGGLRQNLSILIDMPRIRAVVVALFVVQIGQMAASPILPLFVQELSGEAATDAASTAGWVLGATAVTSAVAASLGGRLGDRIGHQRVLAVAAIAAGVLYVPQAFVHTPWQLLAFRALLGIFAGGIQPVAMAIIALLAPPESRGWVFGLTATATALGNTIGPLLGASVASMLGLRASFLFTAIALTAAGIWIAVMVRGAEPGSASHLRGAPS